MRFSRVLLKLSGEALGSDQSQFQHDRLAALAQIIVSDTKATLRGTVLLVPLSGAEHQRKGYKFHVLIAKADCPKRKWNAGVMWCVDANAPCIGCASPQFARMKNFSFKNVTHAADSSFYHDPYAWTASA